MWRNLRRFDRNLTWQCLKDCLIWLIVATWQNNIGFKRNRCCLCPRETLLRLTRTAIPSWPKPTNSSTLQISSTFPSKASTPSQETLLSTHSSTCSLLTMTHPPTKARLPIRGLPLFPTPPGLPTTALLTSLPHMVSLYHCLPSLVLKLTSKE